MKENTVSSDDDSRRIFSTRLAKKSELHVDQTMRHFFPVATTKKYCVVGNMIFAVKKRGMCCLS